MAMIQCFLIAEPNVVAFKALVAKASKRAERLGFEPLSCEPAPEFDCLEEGMPVPLKGYALLGDVPETAEWRIVGSMEHLPDSPESLIRGDVPDHLRHDGTACDHCLVHRKRNMTYILRFGNGSAYKRVGRSCLEDFYDSKAGEKLASYFERLMDLIEEVEQLRHYNNGGGGPNQVIYFAVPEVLAVTARMVREYGWVSASRAEQEGSVATGSRVDDAMFAGNLEVSPADERTAEQILLWLRSSAVVEAAKESTYMHNLWAMADAGAVPGHRIRLMASAYFGWKRAEDAKKEASEAATSNFVGKVHERISLVATLVRKTHLYSEWGDKVLHCFVDDKGNRLSWFATGRSTLVTGQTYHLTGRVKKHDIYRDTMQTVLTRVTCEDLKLFGAIQKKNVKSLKKMLAQGLSIQIQDDDRAGLLHEAVRVQDEAIIDVLLEGQISLDLRDRHGYAPLHLAIANGSESLVTKLLSAGATPSSDMMPLVPDDKPAIQAVLSAAFH